MIKLLACIFMFMDHFAFLFLDNASLTYLMFRLIGRLSMPMFAYSLALGYSFTSNLKKYIYRMILLTIVSQIPLTILLHSNDFVDSLVSTNGMLFFHSWNIGLTFTCALLILLFINKFHSEPSFVKKIKYLYLICLFLWIGSFGDYGIYGISIVLIFYYLKNCSYLIQGICIVNFTFLHYVVVKTLLGQHTSITTFILQSFCVMSICIIKHFKDVQVNLPRNFFYWFYPLHMLILSLINFY